MTSDFAVETIRHAILVALMVSGPLLLTALVVGVVVSLIQAITQIQEQTLTFIPKILAMGGVFLILLPWMASHLISYLTGSFATLSVVGR